MKKTIKNNKINIHNSKKLISESDRLRKLLKNGEEFQEGSSYLRLHRAISWYASAEINDNQLDIKFVSLWISFNACYAIDDLHELGDQKTSETASISTFLSKVVEKDVNGNIYNLLWQQYSQEIRILLDNHFVFKDFWEFIRGKRTEDEFKRNFELSNNKCRHVFQTGNVKEFLTALLKRLYELRNQLFHGGATYNGRVNRKQLKDASNILNKLLPIIIEIMIINKEDDWGAVAFPVINKPY
jgi:hypothetical protein